jgi:hypothetical protein
MVDNINKVTNKRIKSLKDIERNEARVPYVYNNKVCFKLEI